MKRSFLVFKLIMVLAASVMGGGAWTVAHANSDASTAAANGAKKGPQTQMRFDEILVQGKYHFADEAVVTVEEDKVLDALLGARKDFRDRLEKSAARY